MKPSADLLNIFGFVLASLGGALGMIGIFLQTNAYYPFKKRQFFGHVLGILWRLVRHGPADARREIYTVAKLAENKKEDRVQSLFGLYCVFLAFLLQLMAAFALLMASLIAPAPRTGPS